MPAFSSMFSPLLGASANGFTHSVASGDPNHTSVNLWTRYVAPFDQIELSVEVSENPDFRSILTRAVAHAELMTDFCARVRIADLLPGRFYYYRFVAPNGDRSPTGRTRTLPQGKLDRFRIGVMSCANATSGWFNAYAHAAARDDLDLIVHLGDYIYESPVDRSDALEALAVARDIQPLGEAVTLADYRMRYRSYRADPALQELHRQFPMITVWDDHETANNSWENGANNHGEGEGPWDVRKAAGMRAFHEWLPMNAAPYGDYQIGNLATIFRLETRLLARSKQLDLESAIAGRTNIAAAVKEFQSGPLADSGRTLMGSVQEEWLADGFASSVNGGTRWQILAQQVIMAPTRLPEITAAWFAPDFVPGPRDQRELAVANKLSQLGMPLGLDRWDGYPAARDRLFESAARANANLVVLSGDSHNGWAYNLEHQGRPAGVEFANHSVSSLGLDKRFSGDPRYIARAFVDTNAALKWCDTSQRGYMVLNVTREAVTNEWLFLPSRDQQSVDLHGKHSILAEYGSGLLTG